MNYLKLFAKYFAENDRFLTANQFKKTEENNFSLLNNIKSFKFLSE